MRSSRALGQEDAPEPRDGSDQVGKVQVLVVVTIPGRLAGPLRRVLDCGHRALQAGAGRRNMLWSDCSEVADPVKSLGSSCSSVRSFASGSRLGIREVQQPSLRARGGERCSPAHEWSRRVGAPSTLRVSCGDPGGPTRCPTSNPIPGSPSLNLALSFIQRLPHPVLKNTPSPGWMLDSAMPCRWSAACTSATVISSPLFSMRPLRPCMSTRTRPVQERDPIEIVDADVGGHRSLPAHPQDADEEARQDRLEPQRGQRDAGDDPPHGVRVVEVAEAGEPPLVDRGDEQDHADQRAPRAPARPGRARASTSWKKRVQPAVLRHQPLADRRTSS